MAEKLTPHDFVRAALAVEVGSRVTPTALRLAIEHWCIAHRIPPFRRNQVNAAVMEVLGVYQVKSSGERAWRGLRVRGEAEPGWFLDPLA